MRLKYITTGLWLTTALLGAYICLAQDARSPVSSPPVPRPVRPPELPVESLVPKSDDLPPIVSRPAFTGPVVKPAAEAPIIITKGETTPAATPAPSMNVPLPPALTPASPAPMLAGSPAKTPSKVDVASAASPKVPAQEVDSALQPAQFVAPPTPTGVGAKAAQEKLPVPPPVVPPPLPEGPVLVSQKPASPLVPAGLPVPAPLPLPPVEPGSLTEVPPAPKEPKADPKDLIVLPPPAAMPSAIETPTKGTPKDASKPVAVTPQAPTTPWTPKDTTVEKPVAIPMPEVLSPPSVPSSQPAGTNPSTAPTEGTSRFTVQKSRPSATPVPATPVVMTPSPLPDLRNEPVLPPGPRRFQMMKVWKGPERSAVPSPLPHLNELSQPRPHASVPTVSTSSENSLNAQTPQLTVEKRGPLFHKTGGLLKYQIVLKNVGTLPAVQVRVEDEIPGMVLQGANPQAASQENERVVWILPSLKPGEERTFFQELQPVRPGDLVSTTSVHVYASTSFRTRLDGEVAPLATPPTAKPPMKLPMPPPSSTVPGPSLSDVSPPKVISPPATASIPNPLAVDVRAPVSAVVGQKVVFEVVVTNRGASPLTKLMLFGKLSANFSHAEGEHIGADLPDLAPGETKTFKMPVTAAQAGKAVMEVRVTAAPQLEVVARPTVIVEAPGLSIRQSGGPAWIQGRDNELQILVTNNEKRPLRNVEVLDTLPDGVEFLSASDRGLYQPNTRTIAWYLETLDAGETKTISLRVSPRSPGRFPHEVTARAETLSPAKSSEVYQVDGYSSLQVQIQERDDPLEVGKETVYMVRVTNQGATSATNVQVVVDLAPGLEPTGNVQASTAYRVHDGKVIFGPMPQLPPGANASFHLGVRGTAVGEHRVRVQANSNENRTGVSREERTTVYRDR